MTFSSSEYQSNRGAFLNKLYWMTITASLLVFGLPGEWAQGKEMGGIKEATPRLKVQYGHTDVIKSAVFSPNGNTILTASYDTVVILWDTVTGRQLREFGKHSGGVSTTFSMDGSYVLTISTYGAVGRLWNAATGRELRQVKGIPDMVDSVAFSPTGGALLIAGGFHTAWLLDAVSGRTLVKFDGHTKGVTSAVFAPGGRTVLTASWDKTVRLWDVVTGRELRQFKGHTAEVRSAEFSPDGRTIVTASGDKTVRIWDRSKGKELRRFELDSGGVNSAVFSADGHSILTASADHTARLWDVATGQELRRFVGHTEAVESAVFSPDGHSILTASADHTARLWDAATGEELRHLKGYTEQLTSTAFAPDGHTILTGSLEGSLRQWNLSSGRVSSQFEGHIPGILSVLFSSDGRLVLTSGLGGDVRVLDADSGNQLRRFQGHPGAVGSAQFSPQAGAILIAGEENVYLWDATTGEKLRQFKGHTAEVRSAEFSPDGRTILTASSDKTARLWDQSSGQELHQFQHNTWLTSAAFSSDGREILTVTGYGNAYLWDTEGRRLVHEFSFGSAGGNLAVFSPDDRAILTVSSGLRGGMKLWDKVSGHPQLTFHGAADRISHAVFSPKGNVILTKSDDSIARLWNAQIGAELIQLFSFTDGTWIVASPDGRFDTNNLEEIKGLHWIMPDDPFRPLPLEIFMRDYYEPRLLPRVLAGEKFRDLPRLDQLNRAQPKVEIKDVRVDDQQAGLVTVTVEVASDKIEVTRGGKQVVMQSGAFDLRLFRNGQLVGQFPVPKEEAVSGEQTREQELTQWRQRHEIQLDPRTGKQTVTFHGVRLPRKPEAREVEFSAYAFNVDRVKSATFPYKFEIPKGVIPRQGRAYVVTVGINGFETDLMSRLSYAANDAKRLSAELSGSLQAVKDPDTGALVFGENNVVSLALVTEFGTGDQANQLSVNQATKRRIKAVIDRLAGKAFDQAALKGIPNAERLQPAEPEDLVVLAFSTHGDTDRQGQFYLMPSDLGQHSDMSAIRQHAISSEELSEWLRSVDAGELVMIVDACHSAGAVETQEFKPGPMGSRGLGQLAFDKRMRILAASQRDQYALETEKTQQGLLSYALVREGLNERAADFKPKDERIQLSEWLNYGVERVPGLYRDYRAGRLKARAAIPLGEPERKQFISIQEPALFDFARGRDMSLVTGVGR